jgi:hypothetical protein
MRYFLCGCSHAFTVRTQARRTHYIYTDVVFFLLLFNVRRVKVTQCDVAGYEKTRYIDPHLEKLPEPRTILKSDTLDGRSYVT